MDNFEIVSATIADIDQIMAVERAGFEKGIVEKKDVFAKRIRAFPAGFLCLKISDSSQMIGYISSEIWPLKNPVVPEMFTLNHDISHSHKTNGEELYVSSMTIVPEFRNKGLGRKLFEECISRIRVKYTAIKSTILIVNETWEYANRIYLSSGFVELFRIPNFFLPANGLPQTAIVMRKNRYPFHASTINVP